MKRLSVDKHGPQRVKAGELQRKWALPEPGIGMDNRNVGGGVSSDSSMVFTVPLLPTMPQALPHGVAFGPTSCYAC